jgi:cell division protein FtsQ
MRQLSFDDRLNPDRLNPSRQNRRKNAEKSSAARLGEIVQRRMRRHWLLLAITSTVGTVSLAGVFWLSQPGQLDMISSQISDSTDNAGAAVGMQVANVLSEGRRNTSVKDLVVAVGVKRGDPILAFDTSAAQNRVEALGWVRSAVVTRTLPDTIHVRITERRPFALWQNAGRVVLIDRDGIEIGDAAATGHTHLPIVVGADARADAPALFDIMATEPDLFVRVAAAVRIGDRRWDVVFDTGLRANLPENEIADAWVRLVAATQEHDMFNGDVSAVDLRLSDRMVLRLAPESAPAASEGETT